MTGGGVYLASGLDITYTHTEFTLRLFLEVYHVLHQLRFELFFFVLFCSVFCFYFFLQVFFDLRGIGVCPVTTTGSVFADEIM